MVVIDTNVLVRLIAQDDPAQTARALHLIESEKVLIPLTVLLETEWVLRRLTGISPESTLRLLQGVVGLPNVTVEKPERLTFALDLATAGMDFADALHLSALQDGDRFATFDRAMIRTAQRMGVGAVFSP